MSASCLFCKIAQGELDADTLYQSNDVMAFRDINPVAPTHVLVIPRQHIESANELGRAHAAVLGEMLEVIASLAEQERVQGGYRIVSNVGRDAGQSVSHVHFHLIGGRQMAWPPG